jgi:type IV pilus assembly protein PilE
LADGMPTRKMQIGLTLIELMIVIVIVSVLASIALPSYRQHVIRSHRTAAQAAMMDIASREQQFLLARRGYADKAALEASGFAIPAEVADNYDWDVTINAPGAFPTFLITFSAIGGQAADGALTLDSQGNKQPAEKWTR